VRFPAGFSTPRYSAHSLELQLTVAPGRVDGLPSILVLAAAEPCPRLRAAVRVRASVVSARSGRGETLFPFMIPSDEFSFVLPFDARLVTSPASSIAATIMSLLLSVVRHGICLYVGRTS
jgi:hypothetical protein